MVGILFLLPNLTLFSAFASQMAWLGFSLRIFLTPLPRLGIEPTSVVLH